MKAALLVLLALAAPAAWGKSWDFRVLLDGRPIGTHRFALSPAPDGEVLRSEASFRVDFLMFTAYRYEHVATERWRDGCLESLVSRTDDNGEPYAVDWRARGACTLSFAYWNPRILEASALLNAQTGELEPVRVTRLAEERIAGVPARRYRLEGRRLAIDLWYAGERWVALETTAGGRRLRYEPL